MIDILTGDAENLRRLVERATRRTPAQGAAADLDPIVRGMLADVRGLGDELGSVLSGAIDELEHVIRPVDGDAPPVSTTVPSHEQPPQRLPVIHISSTSRTDARIRRNPPANHVIVVDDQAVVYTTDEQGRVVITEATLTGSAPGKRNKYAQRTLTGKLDGDDAGHLIARMLGGIGDKLNLVPMSQTLNREEFAALERRWGRAVRRGKTVDLKLKLAFDEDSRRPVWISVYYKIEGEKSRKVTLYNDPPEETS
ncbi:DNA/RNA non-specific endonuclease [Jiangella alba]|uniref:DNA/RNA non-specific endonuclease n=1 Tax=Jiangella alba TaxID=561176 RepID=A0A1H5N0M8_9ACTN|nr:DNA/RNA non-specific endonuclease [Jiangella alba]SEE94218.1 DNA/RNA non-specific endonuclease [Jiangella alba]